MKVKKIFFLIIPLILPYSLVAGVVHHVMISTTEQKMLGHTFKHVITSGSAEKDEFFIDGYTVTKENYHKDFNRIQKKEWDELAMQQENQRRARIQFAELVQIEVTTKLLDTVVNHIQNFLAKSCNPALEKFFVFTSATIESFDQLNQLKIFMDQLQDSIKKIVESKDVESLNIICHNLERWPGRLEKFYQDTVQQAIRQSDDTAMLKELLTMVCQ